MPDKAQSLLLTQLIAPGYLPGFLSSPETTAIPVLDALGHDLVGIVQGTDFKGLFGQETVPYGVVTRSRLTGGLFCAIRGTDDAEEWLEDSFAVPEPWPFAGHTHKGFTDLYQTLTICEEPLSAYLRIHKPIVTGHSLGAALATLLAADLGPDCPYCETFEGPRVGDKAFCNWMDGRMAPFFRRVIIGDVVPHAPPEILGYSHAGIEIDADPSNLIPHTLAGLHILSSVQTLLLAQ